MKYVSCPFCKRVHDYNKLFMNPPNGGCKCGSYIIGWGGDKEVIWKRYKIEKSSHTFLGKTKN